MGDYFSQCKMSFWKVKYMQIYSIEDHAKLCFKNECTLESVQNFTPLWSMLFLYDLLSHKNVMRNFMIWL